MQADRQSGKAGQKPRVAAVVFNQGVTDVRVVKEAETLAEAGYDVRIFGLGKVAQELVTPRGVPVSIVTRLPIAQFASVGLRMRKSGPWLRMRRSGWLASKRKLTVLFVTITCLFGLISFILGMGTASPDALVYSRWEWGVWILLALMIWAIFMRVLRQALPSTVKPKPSNGVTERILGRMRARTAQLALVSPFLKAIEAFDPAIVHCHDLPTTPIGRRIKQLSNAKLVYDSHELWLEQKGLAPDRRRRDAVLEAKVTKTLDGFITVNDRIGEHLRKRYPSLPIPVIICNATRPLSAPLVYDGRLHQKLELDQSRRILLFQGGMAVGRGLLSLVEASPLLPENWDIVFMGNGNFEPMLRQRASEIQSRQPGGPSRIHFIPPVPQSELPHWTAGASVGIIPYENISLNNWFCSPNKLWEYPISGVPILASPFPVMSKVIGQHGIGWLLDDPVTPESIAARIADLTPETLEIARKNCQTFIAVDNWTVYEKRLVALYQDLLRSPEGLRDLGKSGVAASLAGTS